MATNGLLKDKNHKGIHVGTDGIVDYNALDENKRMTSPGDVGEYDVYITIPSAIQQTKGVYCSGDSCRSVNDKNSWDTDEDVRRAQARSGWVVYRLAFDAHRDKLARKKAKFIHFAIVRHIEMGKPLEEIEPLIEELEERLLNISDEKALELPEKV